MARVLKVLFCFVFSEDANISHASAIQYAGGLVVMNAITIMANNQLSLIAYHIAMKIRVAVCSVIYKKVLRMSQTAMGDASPGKIVNLLSNDVNRFDSLTKFGSALWCSPLLVLAIGYLLWLEVRWAGLIGMAIVFIIVPIQSKYGRQLQHGCPKMNVINVPSFQVTQVNCHRDIALARPCVQMIGFASWTKSFRVFK